MELIHISFNNGFQEGELVSFVAMDGLTHSGNIHNYEIVNHEDFITDNTEAMLKANPLAEAFIAAAAVPSVYVKGIAQCFGGSYPRQPKRDSQPYYTATLRNYSCK